MNATPIVDLENNAAQAAVYLKAMANEKRILILCQLLQGETAVADLRTSIPVSQSGLSQHMGVLLHAGLVTKRKVSQSSFFTLSDEAKDMVAGTLGSLCASQSICATLSKARPKVFETATRR